MKILITGSGGMLGKHLLEHQGSKKHDILAPRRSELDLFKRDQVEAYILKYKPDFIIHAAGVVGGIHANISNPVKFLIENIDIHRNLIMTAYQQGCQNFLNLSCSCMYPRETSMPMQEKSILTGALEPTNEGYALSRIVAQRLCQYISKESPSMKYKTLVGSNLYGPYDHFDSENSHLVAAIISKVYAAQQANLPTVEIWGDGLAKREFMFSADFADCIWRAVENFETLPDLANAGNGVENTINEYYELVAKALNYTGKFIHDLSKPSGMPRKIVDTAHLSAWGWKALTSLEEGLKLTCDYYLNQFVPNRR
jgi:GDP-L-fucose synthase